MKQTFSILLTAIILLQSFSKLVIIADYEINKDYISKVLCENRNKPMMHCNGHCQLKKQLEKDEKQQQSPANPLKEKYEVQILTHHKIFCLAADFSTKIAQNTFYLIPVSDSHLSAVFHPPTV